jgi:guanine deaminase
MTTKLLIADAVILDPDVAGPPAARDILVEDGKIAAVLPPGASTDTNAERLDASNRLVLPGLINAHTHSHGGLGKGLLGERFPLELLLNAAPGVTGGRNTEQKRLSALLSAVELAKHGCTACFDMCAELPGPTEDGLLAVADAYATVGVRAVLAPMLSDITLYHAMPGLWGSLPEALRPPAPAADSWRQSIAVIERLVAAWPHAYEQVRPALGPTIPMHCSDDFLRGCAALSDRLDLPVQSHLAESIVQASVARETYGRSLTAHLDHVGLLGPRFSAAHAIWIDDADIALLAERGCAVAHNPASNLRLGSGVAPLRKLLDAGVAVGIGTDATNTSDGQNLIEAMRLGAYLSRANEREPDRWVDAREAFRAATQGSAWVLGMANTLGRIVPGFAADLVFVRCDEVTYVPAGDALMQFVFAESGAGIDRVMVGGRSIVVDGKMTTLDEDRLYAAAQQAAETLATSLAPTRERQAQLARYVMDFCRGRYPGDVR